jgi:hypothetical protein
MSVDSYNRLPHPSEQLRLFLSPRHDLAQRALEQIMLHAEGVERFQIRAQESLPRLLPNNISSKDDL